MVTKREQGQHASHNPLFLHACFVSLGIDARSGMALTMSRIAMPVGGLKVFCQMNYSHCRGRSRAFGDWSRYRKELCVSGIVSVTPFVHLLTFWNLSNFPNRPARLMG